MNTTDDILNFNIYNNNMYNISGTSTNNPFNKFLINSTYGNHASDINYRQHIEYHTSVGNILSKNNTVRLYIFKDKKIEKIYNRQRTLIAHIEYGFYKNQDGENNYYLHGISKFYFNTGFLESEISYEHGERHGVYKDYYSTGQLKTEQNYIKSEKNGVFKYYSDKGKLITEEFYIDNKRHGLQRYYNDSTGILEKENYYYYGKLNGKEKLYDEEGKLHTEIFFVKEKIIKNIMHRSYRVTFNRAIDYISRLELSRRSKNI